MARTLFPTRPQYDVARCCLLPAILLKASNLNTIISVLDVVVSMSSRSGQLRRRQRFWFGQCRLVRTEYPFGVTGYFEVDDSSSDSCSSHCSGKHQFRARSPPVVSSKRPITSSHHIRISRETVYDPANGVDGEVRDLWGLNGRIVAEQADPAIRPSRTVDAVGLVVIPIGNDMQFHIAGPRRRCYDLHTL